ncbi:amidase signature domain-containing protein [Lasiosphaeria ovina]|uniref:Amidase signature domain-containing protein n=1 Tax=Lasiosphaeria ovina TaxID=92902 RepID=A0AAE0KG27_9PEZI|nr:amidase signature domain-containing protein [Lasiosphaeria ovina]
MNGPDCPSSSHLSGTTPNAGRSWEEIVADKQRTDAAKIPLEWVLPPAVVAGAEARRSLVGAFIEGLLDAETCQITDMDVPDLVGLMESGAFTAVQVTTAFCKRAAVVHQLTRNMLEIGFNQALKRAAELDDYFRAHNKLIGPLHGIPFTLKDQFHIKGLETCMAFVGWIGTFEGHKGTGKEREFESEIIKEFHGLGAIPIGKASCSPETSNNILGYLWSPHNQHLSSGGSSGGEAVMQALKGSAFGVGTDIGGSVSMPASFNGVFSLKPSSGRISMKDVANTGPGQQIMPTVAGIMGRSVTTLRLVLKSLLSTEPWLQDPYVVPLPWRELEDYCPGKDLAKLKPTFGFMENDGIVIPHPPVQRALGLVKRALQEAGYETIDWGPPSNLESHQIHGHIARGDGCPDVWRALQLSGEPEVPQIRGLFEPDGPRDPMSLPEYQDVVVHMRDYRNRYQEYWMSTAGLTRTGRPVDVFISPVTATAGLLPEKFFHAEYTNSTNVLDFPTVVIPVTFVDKDIDVADPNFKPITETDAINMAAYDASAYHGAPAAVQVVGRRLSEEKVLAMAELVVEALNLCKAKGHG